MFLLGHVFSIHLILIEKFTWSVVDHACEDYQLSNDVTTQERELSRMKLVELKAMATELGLKGVSAMRKPQLIEALSAAQGGAPKQEEAPRSRRRRVAREEARRGPAGRVLSCPLLFRSQPWKSVPRTTLAFRERAVVVALSPVKLRNRRPLPWICRHRPVTKKRKVLRAGAAH